jgi:hypothetical protein
MIDLLIDRALSLPPGPALLVSVLLIGLLCLVVWALTKELARRNDESYEALLREANRAAASRLRVQPGTGHTQATPLRTTQGSERVVTTRRVKAGTGDAA